MAEVRPITGTMLRDLHLCEHRLALDMHGDGMRRDPVGEFVRMLWSAGVAHENDILSALPGVLADLRDVAPSERQVATAAALASDADAVLGAEILSGDLLGRPDVIARHGGGWIAGDVKAGSPFAADGTRPKPEYGVQVAHYARILHAIGAGAPDAAFVIGADGVRADYDLAADRGRAGPPIADLADALTVRARGIRDGTLPTRGALSSACGLCHWRTVCTGELEAADDPTLLAGVGRATRDALDGVAPTVRAIADIGDAAGVRVRGVGPARLARFRDRARLMLTPGAEPYARHPLGLVRAPRELHLDLEADPQTGTVYLHGALVREAGQTGPAGEFVHFFADGPQGERDAFAAAIAFLSADPSAPIYYYSAFEPTSYRALQRRHPDVCTPEAVEALFAPGRGVDLLLDVVMPGTEWPTRNVSIKTLAKLLGFSWREVGANGAASIAWYAEWLRDRDPAVRQRIIDYNHDDVLASAVLLDGLIALPVATAPPWPPTPGTVAP